MQFSEFNVWFMYRSGRGPDMVYDELTILLIFVAQTIVLLWQLKVKKDVIMHDILQNLDAAVEDLDGRLAQALGAIAENIGISDLEAPNPFQQLLAQWIQGKINETQLNNVNRGENGQFKSLKDEILDSD